MRQNIAKALFQTVPLRVFAAKELLTTVSRYRRQIAAEIAYRQLLATPSQRMQAIDQAKQGIGVYVIVIVVLMTLARSGAVDTQLARYGPSYDVVIVGN